MHAHALAWAETVAPGAATLLQRGSDLDEAVRRAFTRHGGPVLVVAADTPRLGPHHARMALEDLAEGADASLGPGMDGAWYMAALAAPYQALLDLLAEPPGSGDIMVKVFTLAREADLDIGLLRIERMLRTPRDVRSVRADPLTPDILRRALG